MAELFAISFSGVTLIATVLLGLTLLYWLTVIMGALDVEFFDVDLDVDADGAFISALSFLGLTEIPVTLFLSITVLINWIMMVSAAALLGYENALIGFLLLGASLVVSLLLTRVVLSPFMSLLKNSANETGGKPLVGELCRPAFTIDGATLGQAKLSFDDAELLINVRSRSGEAIQKEQEAIILKWDEEQNCYLITPYDEQ